MSANDALIGDVIEVRELIPANFVADTVERIFLPLNEVPPDYYVLLGQWRDLLTLAGVGEDADGQATVVGPVYVVLADVLATAAVGVSYLVVKGISQRLRPLDEAD